jgi:DNA repair photolyase
MNEVGKPQSESDEEYRQRRFRLAAPIEEGVDDQGPYQSIPISMVLGGKTKPAKVYTEPVKHLLISSSPNPRGWYKDKHVSDKVRPRPCYSEAILTIPYTGYCEIGCKFCYIDFGSRGYHATGLPAVNPDYPDFIRNRLSKMMVVGPAYISSFTEPFQNLETRYHVVERLSKVFVDEGIPLFYLSRKLPPDWAKDILLQSPYSYMEWSVNVADEAVFRRLSPGSFHLYQLYEIIREYADLGIYISIQVNPVLPGIVTLDDMKELVRCLAQAGANHVIFKFCESNLGSYKELLDRLRRGHLEGVEEFESLMTQIIGGVRTIRQDTRVAWLQELLPWTRQHNITMSLCYEYYNNGKGGANLAPWFTTADQCHGPAVPIHYRSAPDARFEPLPGCYRKGCLYCEEYGTKACRNVVLLSAKALQYKDYCSVRLEGREEDWQLLDSSPLPECAKERGRNPNLATDAELWGLPSLDEVLMARMNVV